MDESDPITARLFAAKEARRHRLARASFPEKIAALMRLQAMAAPIQRRRGRQVAPWRVLSMAGTDAGAAAHAGEETAAVREEPPS